MTINTEFSPCLREDLSADLVVELRGAAVDVASDALNGFKCAIVLEKIRVPVARNECGE